MSIFIPPKINNEQLSKIILEKGQIVFNESDNKFYTGNGEVGGEKINKDVPTKTSDLINDSGFITADNIPPVQVDETDPIYTADKPNIALKSELFSKDYNDLTNKPSIPSIQGLASEKYVDDKVSAVKVPSKTSELTNDSGFISSIPQNLVTEQELNNKGYLTSFTQSDPVYSKDKPNLALKSELFSKSYNDLTDKPSIPSIDGLASESYVDGKISAIKVPQKTSELTNDSGFITAQDIPSVQINETDPIYTADKPNIALKSQLFSKSYNDLTDKPELYTPISTGDGTKFLSDDGTYKTVETGGGGGSVDLSDYTGNIDLKYESGKSYLKTSDKTFTIGSDVEFSSNGYTSQMNTGTINAGSLLNITADTFRIMDGSAKNNVLILDSNNLTLRKGLDVYGTINVSNGIYNNNGNSVMFQPTVEYIYESFAQVYPFSNAYVLALEHYGSPLYSLSLTFYNQISNYMFLFQTNQTFEFTISMNDMPSMYINKPFDFQPNKTYLLIVHKNLIMWTEVQKYEG